MAFTYVTITHTYRTAGDTAPAGTIGFRPIVPLHNGSTVISATVTATLSGAGGLSVLLAANTDPATTPTGTVYEVTEHVTGQATLVYYVQIPHDQGSSLDLRDLAGWVGGTGSGGVSTINGEAPDGAGNVTLSASDVGAQLADADLTGLAGLGDGVPVRASGTWGLASGTRDGTKFLRDDGTWQTAGGSAVASVNGQTGTVTLTPDSFTDGTTNKVYTATEKTKLAGVATGATANSADATLLNRANHTGTQAVSTIQITGTPDGTKFLRDDGTWNVPPGGGTGYATVRDEGTALTQRATINFAGAGVTATDDAANSRTLVTIPGGGSSSATLTVINVKTDYGAAGNGSTNDATAIQNALTAAGAAGGGIVYLPPGTYIVNKYLLIPSSVTLMGAGMGVTTVKSGGSAFRTSGGTAPDGGGYSILQATGGSRTNIAVQDLTVDGNESADRAALAASGVRLNSFLVDMRSVTGLRLERVQTRNTWTYNIVVASCSRFIVTGCDVQDPGTTGVYTQLDGIHILGSNKGRIVNNIVDNSVGGDADDGLVAHTLAGGTECYDLIYSHNVVRGGAQANSVQIAGDTVAIYDVTIANNVLWGAPGGFTMQWFSGSGGATIRSVTITGNVIHNTLIGGAIEIICNGGGHFEQLAITGNTIDGYGNSSNPTACGILVTGGNGAKGLAVTGNVIRNGYFGGIELTEGSPVRDYVIASNQIDLTAAGAAAPVGIKLGSSLDGACQGNVVTGKGTGAGTGILMTSTTGATATNQIVAGNRVRAFQTGVVVSNSGGNNPTNTIFTSNITQGNGTGTSFGTATVTSANNL